MKSFMGKIHIDVPSAIKLLLDQMLFQLGLGLIALVVIKKNSSMVLKIKFTSILLFESYNEHFDKS